ncbi:beta-fructofuranosidase [Flavobacterium longum]|uniref:glycoside hydrolase 100 family protein n=1 Tax=Flavobacterium longum TaxID=1299340 RepID=UPI0039EAECED
MNDIGYHKAISLLRSVVSPEGFLASAEDTTNYKRVWARDGVICGLAALASGEEDLVAAFKNTLDTLARNQHSVGTIPSNVLVSGEATEVSYGGLAGRVDAVAWFIIGVCQYAYHMSDASYVTRYQVEIEKALGLLDAWEFNNKHLVYVPLSGNWADEYITDGYVLYDQLLRVWALKSYNHFAKGEAIQQKIDAIVHQIEINFTPGTGGEKYHERAYRELDFQDYMPCSFSPAGYKTQFDAFAHSLALLLNIGTEGFQSRILEHAIRLASETAMGLLPAFWPPVFPTDPDWHLLKSNCKYEFRNHPYEFHNGGSWPMVNGFFGMALLSKGARQDAALLLEKINLANARGGDAFYENFNTKTAEPNGVCYCAWSAAATVLVHQSIHQNFKIAF